MLLLQSKQVGLSFSLSFVVSVHLRLWFSADGCGTFHTMANDSVCVTWSLAQRDCSGPAQGVLFGIMSSTLGDWKRSCCQCDRRRICLKWGFSDTLCASFFQMRPIDMDPVVKVSCSNTSSFGRWSLWCLEGPRGVVRWLAIFESVTNLSSTVYPKKRSLNRSCLQLITLPFTSLNIEL